MGGFGMGGRRRDPHPDPRGRRRRRRPGHPVDRACPPVLRRWRRHRRGSAGWTGQSGAEPGDLGRPVENGDMVEFMGAVAQRQPTTCGRHLPAVGPAVRPDEARAVHGRDAVRVRRGESATARSTARPTRRSTSTSTSSGAQRPVRRAGRLRAGVRDRPRGRAPRPDAPRHRGPGARAAAAGPGPPERAVGPDGAPGGLPRRRVGAVRLPGRATSSRRLEEGLGAAAAVGDDRIQARAGAASTRVMDPWLSRAALAVVQHGLQVRRPRAL